MPKSSLNVVAERSYDDIFSTEESRQEEQREQVQQIPIGELFPFKNHPFKVLDDDSMTRTVESMSAVRCACAADCPPQPGRAAMRSSPGTAVNTLQSLPDWIPCRSLCARWTDDAAMILMVDSNLQREHILPSERAFAYKMKLDAIKNQGARSDLTSYASCARS